jgi:hypothetical protein
MVVFGLERGFREREATMMVFAGEVAGVGWTPSPPI